MRSNYSDDEEQFNSDDSVLGAAWDKVGAVSGEMDNFKYVDAMTNRMNDTDARLLRASIGDRPAPLGYLDESTAQNVAFTNEQHQENQKYIKKVSFDATGGGPSRKKKILDGGDMSRDGKTNVTTNMTVNSKTEISKNTTQG